MSKIKVIGLGIGKEWILPVYKDMIQNADLLVGGKRQLEYFSHLDIQKRTIKAPLDELFQELTDGLNKGKDIVVVADGDPVFFGIGKRLIEVLGKERVEIYPNITVLQVACGKIKISWDDIFTISLHGRKDFQLLFNAVSKKDKIAVFTDPKNSPSYIAKLLLERGVENFRCYVFENLGMDDERVSEYSLDEVAQKDFSPLSFVILIKEKGAEFKLRLGIEDNEFVHEKGLITKKEIRSIALSLLNIEPHHIIWDLGAGCGSVGIESFCLIESGKVICVEKDVNRVELIKKNIKRFGAYGVEVVHGVMPKCLDLIDPPDRVFMGGGIDFDTLEKVAFKLKPCGIWVIHAVLLRSLNNVISFFEKMKWNYELIQVQINRTKDLAESKMFKPLNPVFVLKTKKPPEA